MARAGLAGSYGRFVGNACAEIKPSFRLSIDPLLAVILLFLEGPERCLLTQTSAAQPVLLRQKEASVSALGELQFCAVGTHTRGNPAS